MFRTVVHYSLYEGWPYHEIGIIKTYHDGTNWKTTTEVITNAYEKNSLGQHQRVFGGLHMPGEEPRQCMMGNITMVGVFSTEAILSNEGTITYTYLKDRPLNDELRRLLGQYHLVQCLEFSDPHVWWRQCP